MNQPLAVCVGSPGRFHTFDLGRELLTRGVLRRLYTAYPRWKVDVGLRSRSRRHPGALLVREGARRMHLPNVATAMDPFVQKSFDGWMAGHLEPCEVFHCLSGFGVEAHAVARDRFGAATVCDRGSAHVLTQAALLEEEYDRWGLHFAGIAPSTVERELAEYEACDAVVVPSTFARTSFLAHGVPEAKVHRMPFGVELGLFHPTTTPRAGRFVVLFAGRIGLRKGIGYLLQAMERAVRAGDAEVWLAGQVDPEMAPVLHRFEGAYRLLGHLPRPKLAEVYSKASVLVLPSIEEGLALVLAQAMACGVPVVATPNTGAPDLFSDGVEGFVVPIRDPAAIADRVDQLRRDPDLRMAMGQAAQRRVTSLGGWASYGDSMVGLYRRLLGSQQ